MLSETNSKHRLLKRIHLIFFIKKIFYCMTFLSLISIFYIPLIGTLITLCCFCVCILLTNIGDDNIDLYMKKYDIHILKDL